MDLGMHVAAGLGVVGLELKNLEVAVLGDGFVDQGLLLGVG